MVKAENWAAVSVIALLFLATTCSFFTMPRNNLTLKFRVPLVPLIPNLCVLFNVYLISSLGFWAYVRFIVWNFIGVSVYFFYGVIHTSDPLDTGDYHTHQKETNLVAMRRDSAREDARLLTGEMSA
jgi:APA family basic amino acid/polyamine antiporter